MHFERAILEEYLPKFLSREEIAEEARQVIEEVGATGNGGDGPGDARIEVKAQRACRWAHCEPSRARVAG